MDLSGLFPTVLLLRARHIEPSLESTRPSGSLEDEIQGKHSQGGREPWNSICSSFLSQVLLFWLRSPSPHP